MSVKIFCNIKCRQPCNPCNLGEKYLIVTDSNVEMAAKVEHSISNNNRDIKSTGVSFSFVVVRWDQSLQNFPLYTTNVHLPNRLMQLTLTFSLLGKKLPDRKAINDKGRLTNLRIYAFQSLYGHVLKSNKENSKAMAKEVMAMLYHYSSTEE